MKFLMLFTLPMIMLLSGCTLGGSEGARYAIFMQQERPTILLDGQTGKTWVNNACPDNPNEYNCWQVMKYDQSPDASK